MAVYVDNVKHRYGYMIMCHMVADDLAELHSMADLIGVQRKWFQDKPGRPHYDICGTKRKLAIKHGAVVLSARALVLKLHAIRKGQAAKQLDLLQ